VVKLEFNPWLLFDAVGMRDHYPMVNVTGMQIKDALTRLGKTQSWLAEKMEVTDAAVHKWISTGEIGRDRLVDLARLLGLTVDQLLTGEPAKDT
jgi:plasmid maintenance system antidote protein VapI